jgi:hypothetical protein
VRSTTENLSTKHTTTVPNPLTKMGYCSSSTSCDVRRSK